MSDQFTIDDFKTGDFVELHNDTSNERWFGKITAINKKRKDPLSVHYLKKISGKKWPNLPENLDYYTWWEIQAGDNLKEEYWTQIDCVMQVGKSLFRKVKLDPELDVPTKTVYKLTPGAKAFEVSPPEEEEVSAPEEEEPNFKERLQRELEEQRNLKPYLRAPMWRKNKTKPRVSFIDLGTKPDPRGTKPLDDFIDEPCLECGATNRPEDFILCDGDRCHQGGHFFCFGLEAVPAGDWFCPDCAAIDEAAAIAEQLKQVQAEGEKLGKKVLGTLGGQAILETPTGPESEGEEESFKMRAHDTDHDWEKVHSAVMPPPPSPGITPPPPKKRPATTPLRRSDRQAGTPAEKVTSPEPQEEYTDEMYEVYNERLWDTVEFDPDLYKPFEHPDPRLRHPCLYRCEVLRPPNKGGGVDHYYRRYDVDGNLQEFLNCDANGHYKHGENQIQLRSLQALTRHMENDLSPDEA